MTNTLGISTIGGLRVFARLGGFTIYRNDANADGGEFLRHLVDVTVSDTHGDKLSALKHAMALGIARARELNRDSGPSVVMRSS
jgi:hypothetical protein